MKWRRGSSETQRLEFKEAKEQFDGEKLCKYCVAIGNEGGGALLLGIQDRPPRNVVGTKAFPEPLKTEAWLLSKLRFRVDVEAVAHPDGRVVVIHIPTRPVGEAYEFDGAYWMRAGTSLVPMSKDRLRAIFMEGVAASSFASSKDKTSSSKIQLHTKRGYLNRRSASTRSRSRATAASTLAH